MKNKPNIIVIGHIGAGLTTAVEALSHSHKVHIVDTINPEEIKKISRAEIEPLRNAKEFVIQPRHNYIDVIHDINDTRPFYAKLGKGKNKRRK